MRAFGDMPRQRRTDVRSMASQPCWKLTVAALGIQVVGNSVAGKTCQGPSSWRSSVDAELFHKQGFLHIPRFADGEEVSKLRSAILASLHSWRPPMRDNISSSLSMRKSSIEADHAFLLDSATRASVFLEPGAVDPDSGTLVPGIPTKRAVRKVGHGLHLTDGPFKDFASSPKMSDLVTLLGWQQAAIVQTVYRLAPPLAAGVDRHQDSTFLHTEPLSCLGLWLALEDAGESNGCLHVRQGSHREPLRERLVRRGRTKNGGVRLVFERLTNSSEAPPHDFLPLPTAAGDLVVMHGTLEHFSMAGLDPSKSRESVQVHLVEASANWSPDNWLQYPDGMRFAQLRSRWAEEL